MIPYGRQNISQDDINAVVDVLKSDFLTQGSLVPLFEGEISKRVGSDFAIAVNSATSALHLACIALDVGVGDEVWTSAITFVASANCALYCGATVDFIDIDPDSYNISIQSLSSKLDAAKKKNKLPKVIIPVHFAGQSCDMSALYELSQIYGFKILEDASHALGGTYSGRSIGSCAYSDITVFSFHPVKIITTGEGGMATTNNFEYYQKMLATRQHGIIRADSNQEIPPESGGWDYEQRTLGFNYRMTDIQAALGVTQLQRLNLFISQRKAVALRYQSQLNNLPIELPLILEGDVSSWHLYVIRLNLDAVSKSRREVFDYMRSQGVGVNVHYKPVYLHPYYIGLGFKRGMCPVAEAYYESALTLPIHPLLSSSDQSMVISHLQKVIFS
jgi:UDP-4-amino-4,6-dideoxy-N-acetyl-beta-L-altrosamine transaminase